jgi:hypothetical protein
MEKQKFGKWLQYADNLVHGNIPEKLPEGIAWKREARYRTRDDFSAETASWVMIDKIRGHLREHGIYPLVSLDWIRKIADKIKGDKCLEIMAGSGWLGGSLKEMGVDVISTDISPVRVCDKWEVLKMNAVKSVKSVPFDTLIVSWPPYSESGATQALKKLKVGTRIVYIGEGDGGCTGDDEFHKIIRIHESMVIPNWYGLHDKVYFCSYSSDIE